MTSSVVIHYKELALKGRNRPWFVHALLRNLRTLLGDLGCGARRRGRRAIRCSSRPGIKDEAHAVARLPGIANFARAEHVAADMDVMAATVLDGLRGQTPRRFRIKARRADKRFPLASPEVERVIGGRVHTELGWPVDLTHPQSVIRIEILTGEAFIIFDREPGAGGAARRHRRQGVVPSVGRHRLASGRGASSVEREGAAGALPQLSHPRPDFAGKGARPGGNPDTVSVEIAFTWCRLAPFSSR